MKLMRKAKYDVCVRAVEEVVAYENATALAAASAAAPPEPSVACVEMSV